MSGSDDDNLPFVRKIIARSKSTINLTLDDDDDNTGENAIEVSKLRITRTAQHIDRIPLTDLLLITKVTRIYRRRPHNVVYSGHTCWEEISLEECPSVVALIQVNLNASQKF